MRLEPDRVQRRSQLLFGLCVAVIFVMVTSSCTSKSPPVVSLPTPRLTETPAPTATIPIPTPTSEPLPTLAATVMPTTTPVYLITTITAGEPLALGDLVLTVSKVLTSTLDTPLVADEGRQTVVLDVVIQNTGNNLVSIDSDRELVLKDSSNQVYKINTAIVAAVQGTTLDVDLAPGETIWGRVGFDVPDEARELMLAFGADKFRAGRIQVRLP